MQNVLSVSGRIDTKEKKMYRDEVIDLMSDVVNKMNMEQATAAGVPLEAIEEQISQMQNQLHYVNGLLYDVLKDNGVIV